MIRMSGVGESVGSIAEEFDISTLCWHGRDRLHPNRSSVGHRIHDHRVGLMAAVIGDGDALGYHKAYVFLAIGFGSITSFLMNDSGFWVVQLEWFHRKGNPQDLVRSADCHLFAWALPLPARLGFLPLV